MDNGFQQQVIGTLGTILKPYFFPLLPAERIYWLYLLSALIIGLLAYICTNRGNWSLADFRKRHFNLDIYGHPSSLNDYKFFFVNSIVMALWLLPLTAGIVPLVSTHFQTWLGSVGLQPVIHGNTLALSVLYSFVMVLFIDFGLFVAHTLQHRVPWLWEFHKVHHSAEVMQPLTVYRMHPVDDLLSFAFTAVLAGLADGLLQSLMGSNASVINIFTTVNIFTFMFYLLGYNLRHSNIWLDYGPALSHVFISPAQHQIHHSQAQKHWDKNMGFLFAFWDKLFGTLWIPQGKEEIRFGLNEAGEHRNYNGLLTMYFLPFKPVLASVRKSKAAMVLLALLLLGGGWVMGAEHPKKPMVLLEDLTWTEVRDRIAEGDTTAIVPTGGTEQNGPHMILGKHNYVIRYTAERAARLLGRTLVAPVMAYVPEGNPDPPEGHMQYAGTLSVSEKTFEALLEDTARSLKAHGFKTICFMGDSGGNQAGQEKVAARLGQEWQAEGVKVFSVHDYYYENGQMQRLILSGQNAREVGTHAGIRDTSELMVAHPEGVRKDLRKSSLSEESAEKTGVIGDPTRASAAIGQDLLEMKIRTAVREIQGKRYKAVANRS